MIKWLTREDPTRQNMKAFVEQIKEIGSLNVETSKLHRFHGGLLKIIERSLPYNKDKFKEYLWDMRDLANEELRTEE